ncbi:hypothetical protein DXG03_009453 [Asterophora parasitica]|uniref:S-adenosyl-L-methionine-dependent methyltransferase n=1 Tax=Asterophora parasitica TaxID=117018 RepID=A0A9P7KD12_9AGAR|nr:hypothetical protein DXG03_009453 [Asterophora parasitica]
MNLPAKNEEYGTKDYWEAEDAHFDWFKSYADLAPFIRDLIPDKAARILMLGCGNSKLSEDMWEDGYKNIVNTDVSGFLRLRCTTNPNKTIVFIRRPRANASTASDPSTGDGVYDFFVRHEMDVRDLQFEDDSFDVAIDKGAPYTK